jgi:hypothetical protein
MPSNARNKLSNALKDVDELVKAHETVTGGGRGRPRQRQGAAISRAGIVLLAAAFEAFVEDLFEEAADVVYQGWTVDERKAFLKQTARRLNNADVFKTNYLYFNLGIPWVFRDIKWQKFANKTLVREINEMVDTRNKVAHGRQPAIRLVTLRYWKRMVENLAPRFETKVSAEVKRLSGKDTGW